MDRRIEIGLLDFGLRSNLENSLMIVEDVMKEAILAEKMGFFRLWYGEHYTNTPWLNPEILLPLICSYTKSIKVGIAGAMVLYHSPIQLASTYKLLNNLFAGRIDLGFSKGILSNNYKNYFNCKGADALAPKEYQQQMIIQTTSLLRDEKNNLNNGILIPPYKGIIPEMWNLVSSGKGYLSSNDLGLSCSRTLFLKGADLAPEVTLLKEYKKNYKKKFKQSPGFNIAVAGSCQKDKKALEEIRNHAQNLSAFNFNTFIFGNPEEFKKQLLELCHVYQTSEIMYFELSTSKQHRKTSFKLISDVFKLTSKNTLK